MLYGEASEGAHDSRVRWILVQFPFACSVGLAADCERREDEWPKTARKGVTDAWVTGTHAEHRWTKSCSAVFPRRRAGGSPERCYTQLE